MGAKRKPGVGLTTAEIDELREAFGLFDTSGSGMVDPRELRSAIRSLGFETKHRTIYEIVSELERRAGGREVGFEEFLESISEKLGDRYSNDGLRNIFHMFDPNREGVITLANLKRVAHELGETDITDEELSQILERADSRGKGQISFEDFQTVMTKKGF